VEQRIARRALLVAVIAGLVAELLFDRQPLGIGVPLFVAAVLGCVAWFSPAAHRGRPEDPLDWWRRGAWRSAASP
jgi:hypothetical protein